MTDNWLANYRQMFVSAWIDKHLNFKQHTNNRVESQHSLLKSHLHVSNNTLHRFVPIINKIVDGQISDIKETFTISQIKVMNHHTHNLFYMLRGKVSHKALDHLHKEFLRMTRLTSNPWPCGCRLYNSCGLPCACRLFNYLQAGSCYF